MNEFVMVLTIMFEDALDFQRVFASEELALLFLDKFELADTQAHEFAKAWRNGEWDDYEVKYEHEGVHAVISLDKLKVTTKNDLIKELL